jgi:hypothetical protein
MGDTVIGMKEELGRRDIWVNSSAPGRLSGKLPALGRPRDIVSWNGRKNDVRLKPEADLLWLFGVGML